MSKATTSPTARLLASSRLFSLPRPLPPPLTDALASNSPSRWSDSATLPYPTHQAITAPRSALHRGDFGLKRSLPRQATRTSTPVVKVMAQDTYEHITDFSSAADLVLGERKWAQMGVPMLQEPPGVKAAKDRQRRSVFEADLDNTDPDAKAAPAMRVVGPKGRDSISGVELSRPMQRWKFGGPWVAGMGAGEFEKWLDGVVGKRGEEWKAFVRRRKMEERVAQAQREANEERESLSAEEVARLRVDMLPSHRELPAIFKQLRDDHARDRLGSELTLCLADFLDLPALVPDSTSRSSIGATPHMNSLIDSLMSSDSELNNGPPTTHPAAGLSHLRSSAVMSNHPLYGPQVHPAPIHARVLRARDSSFRRGERQAVLGVGGFATNDAFSGTNDGSSHSRSRAQMSEEERMAKELDVEVEGGNKVWVSPENAFVDPRGKIRLAIRRAEAEALAVKRGGEELENVFAAKRAVRETPEVRGPIEGSRGFGLPASPAYRSRESREGSGRFLNR